LDNAKTITLLYRTLYCLFIAQHGKERFHTAFGEYY